MLKNTPKFLLILYCLLLTLACSRKNLSDNISKSFNKDICAKYAYGNGGMNIGMKYLLDSIVSKFASTNMKDTKYCIFYKSILRRHKASAYFFDSKDTLYFKLDEEETEGFPGKYRLNNKLYKFWFSIEIEKLRPEILKESKEFKVFFGAISNNQYRARKVGSDAAMDIIVLKLWQIDQNKKPQFEFYEFYGDSLIRSPMTKLKPEDKRFKLKVRSIR